MARTTVAALQARVAALEGERNALALNQEYLREQIAELETDERGWQRLSADGAQDFSRDGLMNIVKLSRLMYLKNPNIRQGVAVMSYYVWGLGWNVQAASPDVNAIVQQFLDDPRNKKVITGHEARRMNDIELSVAGEVFWALFSTGGHVQIRPLPCEEIADLITNPEDATETWWYIRSFTPPGATQPVVQLYPDLAYWSASEGVVPEPPPLPASYGRDPQIMADVPIKHIKTGGMLHMRRGVPETYAALDWARAYREFLEDWATITRAYARFAWKMTTKSGAQGVAQARSRLGSSVSDGTSGTPETNPPPSAGAFWIQSAGYDLDPMKTKGATTSAQDGKNLLLMVASAMGLPVTFFGDVDSGTLATARSLDRPTELKFRSRQTMWADVFYDVFLHVLVRAITEGQRLTGATVTWLPNGQPEISLGEDAQRKIITVSMPDILERDIDAAVRAIVLAATLNGQPNAGLFSPAMLARMLLVALSYQNVDEYIEAHFDQAGNPKAIFDPVPQPRVPADMPGDAPGDLPAMMRPGNREPDLVGPQPVPRTPMQRRQPMALS